MTRNTNAQYSHRSTRSSKAARRPVHGRFIPLDALGGVEKFKSDRRQARRQWRKEDERYDR
jgi:hypothetical protein